MAENGQDGAVPGLYEPGALSRELPRRVASPASPLYVNELTPFERVAIGLLAMKDPDLAHSLALHVLSVVDSWKPPSDPDRALSRAVDDLLFGWCDRCFRRVAYDREGVPLEWPPAAHGCAMVQSALSSWRKS